MHSFTEENYLKAIFHLLLKTQSATTNEIAAATGTKAASVTDMLKKLAEKKLINYARYQGVTLTDSGERIAVGIVRKHRLWEHFLVDKLKFKWDEVHEMAEELEHISSTELINRLDEFMGRPQFDPHGDPIPDCNGRMNNQHLQSALHLKKDQTGKIAAVADHSPAFLQYLEKTQLTIGQTITVTELTDYDMALVLNNSQNEFNISREVAKNLLILV
ncbi:metal-dependent transcriptional regulator [Mucilaginibacter aquatilis]|uniref:Transcriptional regulator MntR n=1 Tax=Mucilaginibacter aquatilis TaxID=1517760 RepID=A0A6I4I7T6_9SPHI|nr:metal-dependent transcriptional regulator [Mucilaginibacter aquatilis]MVN89539.1 metal-dependent transcriptional regulator [Mucilaginibacter aquatilis]